MINISTYNFYYLLQQYEQLPLCFPTLDEAKKL
jgi:hypothetical protein